MTLHIKSRIRLTLSRMRPNNPTHTLRTHNHKIRSAIQIINNAHRRDSNIEGMTYANKNISTG
jgi:hypothetical protein